MDTREVIRKYRGSLGVWLGAVVVLGLVFGPGIVDEMSGDTLSPDVQAGAAIEETPGDPGTVTVRWTSNQNAVNLTVWVEGPADVAGPTNASTVVLDDVGEAVAFEETGATGENRTVTAVVVAENEDGGRITVLMREVTL